LLAYKEATIKDELKAKRNDRPTKIVNNNQSSDRELSSLEHIIITVSE